MGNYEPTPIYQNQITMKWYFIKNASNDDAGPFDEYEQAYEALVKYNET